MTLIRIINIQVPLEIFTIDNESIWVFTFLSRNQI